MTSSLTSWSSARSPTSRPRVVHRQLSSTTRVMSRTFRSHLGTRCGGGSVALPFSGLASVSVRPVVTRLAPNGHHGARHHPQERESPAMATGLFLAFYLQNTVIGGEGGFEPPVPLARHNGFRVCSSCLLYTSPSPRDGLLSRMPSSA